MSPPGRWLELRVRGQEAGDLEPLLAEALIEIGGSAAEERDGWYLAYLPDPLDDPLDLESFVAGTRARLAAWVGTEALEISTAWVEHEEWAETWRRGLEVRRVSSRLVVRPSWLEHEDPREGDLVITLDPGMAFGNAEHGTTRGCLRLLEEAMTPGDRVLDVGSGSGILAIAAARLGAAWVLAVESDSQAIETLARNIERNGVEGTVGWAEALVDVAWLRVRGPVSGISANIESGVLRPLLPGFFDALRPGGWLILSGILVEEWPALVDEAAVQGLRLERADADGVWRSGLFRRP